MTQRGLPVRRIIRVFCLQTEYRRPGPKVSSGDEWGTAETGTGERLEQRKQGRGNDWNKAWRAPELTLSPLNRSVRAIQYYRQRNLAMLPLKSQVKPVPDDSEIDRTVCSGSGLAGKSTDQGSSVRMAYTSPVEDEDVRDFRGHVFRAGPCLTPCCLQRVWQDAPVPNGPRYDAGFDHHGSEPSHI